MQSMKKFFTPLTFALAIFLFISCSSKTDTIPSKVIPKDKMADILVDVHLAEASAENRGLNSPQINIQMAAKYDSLFQKHETSFSQFKSSYDYYLDHPDELSEIYTIVVNKLTTIESKINSGRKIKPSPIEERDTILHH